MGVAFRLLETLFYVNRLFAQKAFDQLLLKPIIWKPVFARKA